MDKYSSSVSIIRLSNSLPMFDILDNLTLNNYSKSMNYLITFPLLANQIKPLAIVLIVMAVVFFLAALGILIYLIISKKKENQDNGGVWLLALGNKENVKEVSAIGSRLTVNLEDKEKIDRIKLKELGVSSVLVMSNKITLVIEGKAEKIANLIKKDL